MPGAIAVIALAEGRGTMFNPGHLVYMDKIAVGPEAAGAIELEAPIEHNLRQVAKAKRKDVNDLRVLILDRERNQRYIDGVRLAGARISLIRDGDVAGAIATARDDTAADVLLGIGGSPEAVIAAAALKCIGGEIQCKLWPRDAGEREQGEAAGFDLERIMGTNDLVSSDNVFFAATGVTGGEYLPAVEFRREDHVVTHSVIMRSKTGSIRYMEATHNIARLGEISAQTLD
jgi:fructose-1,6-bisphosphatase II